MPSITTFGPSSVTITISEFATSSRAASATQVSPVFSFTGFEEYDVKDIQEELTKIWHDPRCSAYLTRHLFDSVTLPRNLAKSKKKAASLATPEADKLLAWLGKTRHSINEIVLSSWQIDPSAIHFIRTSKLTDSNTIIKVKSMGTESLNTAEDIIIVVSIHNKLPNGASIQTSQHIFTSTQTLSGLFQQLLIGCPYATLPKSLADNERDIRDTRTRHFKTTGCVCCIENTLIGDMTSDQNTLSKLAGYLNKGRGTDRLRTGSKSLEQTAFNSLRIQTQEPYWLFHQGCCEHIFVIDQIRSPTLMDPSSGYPYLIRSIPRLIDLCRACTKVPAACSIIGDLRLGESPCILCGSCWRSLGPSKTRDQVIVLPLV